jgi:1-deoxy-D-xylulose-5-phosphate synthase
VAADLPAVRRVGPVDVLREGDGTDVLLVAVGAFAALGLEVADRLAGQGLGVTVVDPRWVRPVPIELVGLAARHRLVVTVEDGVRAGGVGEAVAGTLRDAGVDVPLRAVGVPVGFHPHGTRAEILDGLGLTPQDIARDVTAWISALERPAEPQTVR